MNLTTDDLFHTCGRLACENEKLANTLAAVQAQLRARESELETLTDETAKKPKRKT